MTLKAIAALLYIFRIPDKGRQHAFLQLFWKYRFPSLR